MSTIQLSDFRGLSVAIKIKILKITLMNKLLIRFGSIYLCLEILFIILPLFVEKLFSIQIAIYVFQYSFFWFVLNLLIGGVILITSFRFHFFGKDSFKGKGKLAMLIGCVIITIPFVFTYFIVANLH